MLRDFSDFCDVLLRSGFSMGGGNDKGIYAVVPYSWENQEGVDSPVKWHTGNPDTDPWEWRMRVLEERSDIAYAKLFFRISGYITKDWYPYFYAVRRQGETLEEAYQSGTISQAAKRIYEIVAQGEIPLHEIKRLGGFTREDNAAFERAVVELQMRMYVTLCGRAQKINRYGENYGWSSTVLTTVEDFWEKRDVMLPELDPEESYEAIREQILILNPTAQPRKIEKFIRG